MEEHDICPYCGFAIMYNSPDDFDPVTADDNDTFYHDDCYFDLFEETD